MNNRLILALFVIFISTIYAFPSLKRVDSMVDENSNRVQHTTPNQLNLKNRIALTNYLRQLDNKYSTFNVAKVRFGKRGYSDVNINDNSFEKENEDSDSIELY